jgi:hypothetical protein
MGLALALANQAAVLHEMGSPRTDSLPLAEQAHALARRHNLVDLAARVETIAEGIRRT